MKNIKLFLFAFLTFTLMSATCEPEPVEEEECLCKIEGTKLISFNQGVTWSYAGMDDRTGLMFPCYFDNTDTNQVTEGNALYKTHWECKD